MIALLAQQTNNDPNAGAAVVGLIVAAFFIFAAVKTAMNGRWGLFVLGFFCGIAWIAGWMSGPKHRYGR